MEVKIHDSSTLTSAPSGCEKMMDSKQEEGATEQQEQSVDTSIRIANQINHDLPQANNTHSAVGLQEQDICWLCCSTGGQVCYYGAVSIIGIVLVWAAVLFLMGIHSFFTGDFCVDSGDAYDSTPLIEMGHAFTIVGHMFGFMGAIAALSLLVLWNPPLVQTIITEEHHDAEVSGDLIRPSFECVSAGLLIDGILIILIGLSKKKGYKDMDEPTMPAWVWSVPFFLVGISMFAIFAILMIRQSVAPIFWKAQKQRCVIPATHAIFLCHIFLSIPFGSIYASVYNNRYCPGNCSPVLSKYCTSVSDDS